MADTDQDDLNELLANLSDDDLEPSEDELAEISEALSDGDADPGEDELSEVNDASSESDLSLNQDELSEVIDNAENAIEDIGTSDDLGLIEDFSLEGEGGPYSHREHPNTAL